MGVVLSGERGKRKESNGEGEREDGRAKSRRDGWIRNLIRQRLGGRGEKREEGGSGLEV